MDLKLVGAVVMALKKTTKGGSTGERNRRTSTKKKAVSREGATEGAGKKRGRVEGATIDKSLIVRRRANQLLDAFVQTEADSTAYGEQPRDVEQILKIIGRLPDGDPYDGDTLPESEEQLHRFAIDLLHGPTTISPQADGGAIRLRWRNFEVAFGSEWRTKQKIASHLFEVQLRDGTPLLPNGGTVVIGPGGTAFHVALQFAWRMRARFELGSKHFDGCQYQIHTDSFEVARLLGPLALDDTVQAYLSGTNVSRSQTKARPKVSILMASRRLFEPGAIDCLVIGCQKVDDKGTVFTWPQSVADHRVMVQEYLDALAVDGRLILVCAAEKIGKAWWGETGKLSIKHPEQRCFIVTDSQPSVEPPLFQPPEWPGKGTQPGPTATAATAKRRSRL